MESKLLECELNAQEIPHVITSYGDAAFDGVYQISQGWGYIEAPTAVKGHILALLQDIRTSSSGDPST